MKTLSLKQGSNILVKRFYIFKKITINVDDELHGGLLEIIKTTIKILARNTSRIDFINYFGINKS